MGFVQKLKLRDPSGTKNAPTRKAVLYVVDDATGEATPVTAGQLGGGGGGGGDSAVTVAKLEELRVLAADTNSHTQAANGNSYVLASQALGEGIKVQIAPGAATASEFLNPQTIKGGFTPAVNGTLLIQNLCRTCYYEGYVKPGVGDWEEGELPLYSAPTYAPMLSVGPERWAAVPVVAGRGIGLFMNGNAGPDHLDEVSVVFLPGVVTLAGGDMPRHIDANAAGGYEAVANDAPVRLSVHADANRAQVIIVSGTAKMGLGSSDNGALYREGEGLGDLGPSQITALKIVSGVVGQTVTFRVDYWRQS